MDDEYGSTRSTGPVWSDEASECGYGGDIEGIIEGAAESPLPSGDMVAGS